MAVLWLFCENNFTSKGYVTLRFTGGLKSQMKQLYIDEPAKWKTWILHQIQIVQLIQLVRAESHTVFQYSVQARLSAHSDWISCTYMYVFGAMPSSSILRAHLYTTHSSMLSIQVQTNDDAALLYKCTFSKTDKNYIYFHQANPYSTLMYAQ